MRTVTEPMPTPCHSVLFEKLYSRPLDVTVVPVKPTFEIGVPIEIAYHDWYVIPMQIGIFKDALPHSLRQGRASTQCAQAVKSHSPYNSTGGKENLTYPFDAPGALNVQTHNEWLD